MNAIHRVSTALNAAAPPNSPEKIKGAAQQFEALMISEMLKTARESTSDEDGGSSQNMTDLGEQQVANVMAKAGGLGLQRTLVQGLTQR